MVHDEDVMGMISRERDVWALSSFVSSQAMESWRASRRSLKSNQSKTSRIQR